MSEERTIADSVTVSVIPAADADVTWCPNRFLLPQCPRGSVRVEMEDSRRRKLCAAMAHSNQCYFNNCDKIDGACGKTKRIIKASSLFRSFPPEFTILSWSPHRLRENHYPSLGKPNKGDVGQFIIHLRVLIFVLSTEVAKGSCPRLRDLPAEPKWGQTRDSCNLG